MFDNKADQNRNPEPEPYVDKIKGQPDYYTQEQVDNLNRYDSSPGSFPDQFDTQEDADRFWTEDRQNQYFELSDRAAEWESQNDGGYWQPQQIARFANFIKAQPDDFEYPDWMDTNAILSAYEALATSNKGQPAENWKMNDMAKQYTASLKTPPVEAMPDYEKSKATYSAIDLSMKAKGFVPADPSTLTPDVVQKYAKDQPQTGGDKFYIPAPQETNYKPTVVDMANEWISGMPAEEYNKLLPIQRPLNSLMAQVPNAMVGLMALNAGKVAAGVATSVTGSPAAGVIAGSAAAGMVIVGTNYANELNEDGTPKNKWAYNTYMLLDYLVNNAEKAAGILLQMTPDVSSLVTDAGRKEWGQNLADVARGIDIQKTWDTGYLSGSAADAGSLLFESTLIPTIYDKDNNLVSRSLTSPDLIKTKQDKIPEFTIPISDQMAEAMMLNPDFMRSSRERQAAWEYLKNPTEENDRKMGLELHDTYENGYRIKLFDDSFIKQARQRIAAGENAQEVYNDIVNALGYGAPVGELAGQIFFDPLDKAPGAIAKVTSKVADVTGHQTAATAFGEAEGPISGIRNYGELVRGQLTADQAANLNPISKWAAGLEATAKGQPTQIRGYGQQTKNPFDYLFGLDNKSRATQVLDNTTDGINQAIDLADGGVDGMVAQIDVIAGLDAKGMTDGLNKSKLPKWFDSMEAQYVPSMVQDVRIKAKELQTQWHMGDRDRQTITKIAEALDIEPHKLVADLHNSKDGKAAETTYRQFIDTVAEKAAEENGMDIAKFREDLKKAKTPEELAQIIPDGQASNLLKALLTDQTNGRLTAASLKIMADKFTGENPVYIGLDESLFKARLMAAVQTSIGQQSVKFFGVKPSNKFMRSVALAKKAQSIVLLGQNPANYVNNTLNNWATLGADFGLRKMFGLSGESARAWMDETGIRSSRMDEGALYTAETGDKPVNEISKATRGDDAIQSASDKVGRIANKKVGGVNVATPFSQLSRKSEQLARDVAFTIGAREFLDSHWIPGKGFDKIDGELRMVLDSLEPGLADRYERAVGKAKNIKDIEKMVYSTVEKPSIKDVLSGEEIAQYRKFNAEAFDALEKDIESGQPAWKAMDNYKKSVVKAINETRKQERANQIQTAMLKSSAEGAKGIADVMANNYQRIAEYHFQHMNNMAEVAEKTRTMNNEQYSAEWARALSEASEGWDRLFNDTDVDTLGMLRGLGEIDDTEAAAFQTLEDLRLNNRSFFNIRQDLWNEHRLTDWGDDKEAKFADIARIQAQLNEVYADMLLEEAHLQFEVDNHLREAHVKGARNELEAKIFGAEWDIWTGERQRVRQKMAQQELLFRTGEIRSDVITEFGDLIPADVKKEILRLREEKLKDTYYREIYQRGIAEMVEVTNKYAPGRVQGTQQTIEVAKPYQDAAQTAKQRGDLRKIAHDVANINNDMQIVNTVKKYGHPEVNSFADITPDILRDALMNREAEKARPIVSTNRDKIAEGLKASMNLTDAQVKARMALIDSTVKLFAEEKGVAPEEIYGKFGFDNAAEGMAQGAKGEVDLMPLLRGEGPALISGSPIADISTALHEPGHVFLPLAPDADKATVTKWLNDEYNMGLEPDWMMQDYRSNDLFTAAHEKFARALEKYHRDGIAPKGATKALISIFNKMREWMTQIYREVKGSQIDVELSPELTHMLDEWASGRRLEVDPKQVVAESAQEMVKPETLGVEAKDISPLEQARLDYEKAKQEIDPILARYLPEIIQGVKDWGRNQIYIDGKGNYRYTGKGDTNRGRIIPYNKELKKALKDGGSLHALWIKTEEFKAKEIYESEYRKVRYPHREEAPIPDATPEVHTEVVQAREQAINQMDVLFQSDVNGNTYSSEDIAKARKYNSTSGKQALENAITNQIDIPSAFYRPEIGDIDIVWGNVGDPAKNYKGGKGLAHIIAKRNLEGIDGVSFARDLYKTISNGEAVYRKGRKTRIDIFYENIQVVLVKDANSNWILTGFQIKTPDANGNVRGLPNATPDTTTVSRRIQGAGDKSSIAQQNKDSNALKQIPEYAWTPETLRQWVKYTVDKVAGMEAMDAKKYILDVVRQERGADRIKLLRMIGWDIVGRNGEVPDYATPVYNAMKAQGELATDHSRWSSETAKLLQEAQPGEKLPTNSTALGTVDSIMDPPMAKGMDEYYRAEILPMLARLEKGLGTPQKTLDVNLDPKAQARLDEWVSKVKRQRADVNLASVRHGEGKADFALLNYGRQTMADNLTNVVMPYQFWYGRSMFNWALRAIEKPKLYADYFRLMNFMNSQTEEREGYPYRLRGKSGMKLPFLPDWAGDVYIDPYKQIYPFLQMARPWANLLTAANREDKKAQTILQDMVDNGELTQAEADEAINTKQGQNWKSALAQARNELDTNTGNPLDAAQTISGFSLPVSTLINLATGRTDRMGMLPATRLIKSLTGVLGANNYKGVDLSIKGLGGDAYEDARIRTMLGNMAANGEYPTDVVKQAMITKSGEAYTEATRKVAWLNFWKAVIPGMGLDFYPEGEQKAREMNNLYKSEAIPAFEAGDTKAKSKFFDANPALSARYQSFENDPEMMLNKYLVGEVWEGYNSLPDLYKKQAREQLGSVFTDWLNPETRGTINDEMLAGWANAMGRIQPKEIDAVSTPIRYAEPKIAKQVQDFYDLRKEKFPFYNDIYNLPEEERTSFYQSKEYKKLKAWSDAYKANHPEIIPWVTKETDKLYGVDPKIAAKVYAYRAEEYGKFGDVSDLWNKYNSLPEQARPAFKRAHPELDGATAWKNNYLARNPQLIQYIIGEDNSLYGLKPQVQAYVYQYRAAKEQQFPGINENWDNIPWSERNKYLDWQKKVAAAFPEAAPYIVSDNTIRKGLGQEPLPYNPVNIQDMSPELQGQYKDLIYGGRPLTTGANKEMRRLWESWGRPTGDYQKFLNSLTT